ncbi:MAG: LytTR family transcriptional regulator DNA-binding domain-containing protein, partial [Pseudomonadota bacterium]
NLLLGTLCFAVAVSSVHFLAMAGTSFVALPTLAEFGPVISNEVLALAVILTSFVLLGSFLWVGITHLVEAPAVEADAGSGVEVLPVERPARETIVPGLQVPCERDGGKVFISARDVALVRADGHYTQVYTEGDRLFCVWPITVASKRLAAEGLLQTHRSYVVNPSKVSRFERSKDKGRCIFAAPELPPAPVSRSRLKVVQDTLSTSEGAVREG